MASAKSDVSSTTIDEAEAANLAASVATSANLSVAGSVYEQSTSISVRNDLDQRETATINKPQSTDSSVTVDAISSYVAVEGDTAVTIAEKFGVSAQTIRWANNLSGDAVSVGATLTIPLVDGVVYTAKDGDTLKSIAEKYGSSVDGIVEANNLDSGSVVTGTKLLLPGGILPESERPGATVRRTTYSSSNSSSSSRKTTFVPYSSGNTYAYGNCTWYVFNRRSQLGMPIPSNFGNAKRWDENARASGYKVDNAPSIGAVMQSDGGGYGHVTVVEKINADGSIVISEMNAHYGVDFDGHMSGFGRISHRIVTNPGDYDFIH